MNKTIICLYAPANCGKTKSIRKLFIKLGGDKQMLDKTYDFVGNLSFRKKELWFASQGDPNSSQLANLEIAARSACDIIVTASRTKGNTVDNVNNIAKKYGYSIVWISPFYFNDAKHSSDDLLMYFAEQNANNIAKYIIENLI